MARDRGVQVPPHRVVELSGGGSSALEALVEGSARRTELVKGPVRRRGSLWRKGGDHGERGDPGTCGLGGIKGRRFLKLDWYTLYALDLGLCGCSCEMNCVGAHVR